MINDAGLGKVMGWIQVRKKYNPKKVRSPHIMNKHLDKIIQDKTTSTWLSLECLLSSQTTTIGALATTIEKEGIYTWDRFGRYGLANDEDKIKALNLLAELYSKNRDSVSFINNDDEQIEQSILFGWAGDKCPDFKKYEISNPEPPKSQSSETKALNTAYILIFVLAKKAKIDINERGAAAKIVKYVELAGLSISDQTVSNWIKKINESLD
jgi:hypothetical protein